MGTDDAAQLSDGDLFCMIADDRLAVTKIFIHKTVVQIAGIGHHNRHRKINAAAAYDAGMSDAESMTILTLMVILRFLYI